MDSLTMLLMGWFLFLFSSLILLKYIYRRYVKKVTKEQKVQQQESTPEKNHSAPIPTNDVFTPIPAVSTPQTRIEPVSSKIYQKTEPGRSLSRTWSSASVSCTGPDPVVVDYVDKCFSWLYSPTLLAQNATNWDNVKDSLIDSLGRTLREQGKKELPIFVSVVDINLTNQIQISNLYAECEHTNNAKITCDLEATKLNGVLSLYSTAMGSSSCEFFIDRICGRLNILLDCDEMAAIVKFDGWPEICVGIKKSSLDTKLDSKISEYLVEKLAGAIRGAVLEIEFKKFSSFPVASMLFTPMPREQGKKYLVVKILSGIDLGLAKGCEEPFCAIELDDPPQKFQTEHQTNSNPSWNENFVFNILPSCGGELLFEVYDFVGTRFLGCNIVSVDEILNYDFGTTRTIPLKTRRMELADQISGHLEVQFNLMAEEELVAQAKVERLKGGKGKSALWNGNLKELEISSKHTLVVQPQEPPKPLTARPVVKIIRTLDGSILEVDEDEFSEFKKKGSTSDGEQTIVEGTYGEERGRRRTRRGDIFTSIRRRFSKGRSISALPATPQTPDQDKATDIFGRSISADRKSTGSGAMNTTLGVNSTRSSASELSGLSGQSTTTFIHENSTLVVECVENRVKKYYLVPPHLAESGKWKKRGKKLHIYNDHTFVAKRLQSGTPCAVCFGRFQFSLGKQGYQCRDCKVKCHKECHVRIPSFCANTTVYDIELAAVKPLPATKQPKLLTTSPPPPKKSTSPLKSITSFFGGKKKSGSQVHPTEETPKLLVETPPQAQLELPTVKLRSKKKRQAPLEAAMPVAVAVPLNGAAPVTKATKTKTTKRMNIFKRKTKLPLIQEEANPVSTNSASSQSKSAAEMGAGDGVNHESTVSVVLLNEEEPSEQEITTILAQPQPLQIQQIKCNSIIVNKNIKNYSVE